MRQSLRRDQGAYGVLSLAFAEQAFEQVAADGAPSAGLHADGEYCLRGALGAAGGGVDVVRGAEDDGGRGEHGVLDTEDSFVPSFFERGQDEAVLTGEQVEDGSGL